MARTEAAHRSWAEAIFALAKGAGKVDEFEAQLHAVAKLFADTPALRVLAATPRVRVEAKQKILERAFKGKVEPLLYNALQLAAVKRRLPEIGGIARAFSVIADAHHGRARVRVTTAVELDEATGSSIEKAIGQRLGKTAVLEERVNPDILGGLIIEHGDLRIDGSLKRRLNEFLREAQAKVRAPEAT